MNNAWIMHKNRQSKKRTSRTTTNTILKVKHTIPTKQATPEECRVNAVDNYTQIIGLKVGAL